MLIRLGANINLKDNDNRNVLHAAVIHGGDLDRILDDEYCVSSCLFVIKNETFEILIQLISGILFKNKF